MKRRLTIARALINEPSILLLDEPTTGLDPQARHLLWERLYRLKQRGVTLVLTTHYMDEAEQLCDRLVVMDKAKIVAEGSPRQLIERYATREVTEMRFPVGVQETLDGQLDGLGERVELLPDRVLVYSDDGEAVAAAAHRAGLVPETVLVRRELARGRVPAAHRPQPGGLMAVADAPLGSPGRCRPAAAATAPVRVAAYEHQWLLYVRTWRGSIFGNFAQPVLFLVAMGIGLGSYVDAGRRVGAGWRPVPPVAGAGPARVDGDAGLGVRGHVPGPGRVPLDPPLPRDVRDAD